MSNIGRAIVKKLAVKFEGNEIMSVDDFDVFACYRDLWKTKSEKRNATRQGIISNDGCMENYIKLRINAGDKNASNTQDKAIADGGLGYYIYRNKKGEQPQQNNPKPHPQPQTNKFEMQ